MDDVFGGGSDANQDAPSDADRMSHTRSVDDLTVQSRERIVMGALLLGFALIAVAGVTAFGMVVNGRRVPPDVVFAVGALVVAVVTLAGSVWLAVRLLGRAEGFKVIRREMGAGLWAGAVGGFLVGFLLRAAFPGPALWLGLIIAYAAAVGFICWLAMRSSTA